MAKKRRASGEGGLYQRKSDGLWVGALPAALSPTGRRVVVYGATRAEALDKLDDRKAAARAGEAVEPSRRKVADLLAEYLQSLAIGGAPARTYALREKVVRLHLAPKIGHVALSALAPAHLTRLYHGLLTGGRVKGSRAKPAGTGLSATYVNTIHATLHQALGLAVRWRYVARNVADLVDPPSQRPKEGATLTADALRAFLAECARTADPLAAAWHLAADAGLRRSELAALQWDDFVEDANGRYRVLIRRILQNEKAGVPTYKEPKTARGRRGLTLSATTVNALAAHRQAQDAARARDPAWRDYGLVFPAAHGYAGSAHRLYEHFRRAAKRAKLPEGIRLHDLRHTMATLSLTAGATVDAVSRRLGHASPSITLGVYSHVIPTAEEAAAEVMARILAPPPAVTAAAPTMQASTLEEEHQDPHDNVRPLRRSG